MASDQEKFDKAADQKGIMMFYNGSALDRFESKYIPVTESGCWIWTAYINKDGYAKFRHNKKCVSAHRFIYEVVKGEIPQGLVIDHKCRVRCCVNPDHLELVTNRENILRGEGIAAKNIAKTHCPHGHTYSFENTFINSSGKRECKICRERYNERRRKARGN